MTADVKIGTRGSPLALWQANWVAAQLKRRRSSSLNVAIVVIKTRGDKIQDVPLARIGGKGLFVKEIEQALLDGRIDLAVHSMKDMPAEIPAGLCIAAVPRRDVAHDVLISRSGRPLEELPHGACIGTSSLRRGAQLRHLRRDLMIHPLRGNVGTRLKKLESGNVDAIILAAAGLRRMGFEKMATQQLPTAVMLPAAGQGALCIEARRSDADIAALLAPLEDPLTRRVVGSERAFLNRLGGSCQVPIAAFGRMENGSLLHLVGLVADIDGSLLIKDRLTGPAVDGEALGVELAERLLMRGADKILARLNQEHACD